MNNTTGSNTSMNKSRRQQQTPQMPSVHPMVTRSISRRSLNNNDLSSVKEEPKTPSQDMGKSSADDISIGTEEELERIYSEQKSRIENSIRLTEESLQSPAHLAKAKEEISDLGLIVDVDNVLAAIKGRFGHKPVAKDGAIMEELAATRKKVEELDEEERKIDRLKQRKREVLEQMLQRVEEGMEFVAKFCEAFGLDIS